MQKIENDPLSRGAAITKAAAGCPVTYHGEVEGHVDDLVQNSN